MEQDAKERKAEIGSLALAFPVLAPLSKHRTLIKPAKLFEEQTLRARSILLSFLSKDIKDACNKHILKAKTAWEVSTSLLDVYVDVRCKRLSSLTPEQRTLWRNADYATAGDLRDLVDKDNFTNLYEGLPNLPLEECMPFTLTVKEFQASIGHPPSTITHEQWRSLIVEGYLCVIHQTWNHIAPRYEDYYRMLLDTAPEVPRWGPPDPDDFSVTWRKHVSHKRIKAIHRVMTTSQLSANVAQDIRRVRPASELRL